MSDLLSIITAAIAIFVSTNIDDIVVLTVLFLASNASGRPKVWQIVAGQYAGIAVLVVLSMIAALGLTLIPNEWVGLFGLIPLGLGIRGLVQAVKERNSNQKTPSITAKSFAAVAGITVANGGDNIAVYTPFFHSLNPTDIFIVLMVFAISIAAWCMAAAWLGRHKHLVRLIERFGHWMVPVVFVVIGLVILSSLA